MLEHQSLTKSIIGKAIEVHKTLGPGLLESAYQICLAFELKEAGLDVRQEVPVPISYKGITLEQGYRIDILVNNIIVLELKAISHINPMHEAQLLTYLRLGNYPVGLLINFNEYLLKNGIKRLVN